MHFHAEHPLFFERRRSLRSAVFSLALALVVLVANAGVGSPTLSLACAGVGSALLLVSWRHGRRRVEPALAWGASLVALALLAGLTIGADASRLIGTATRILCGVVWVLWLGTVVDWASLRLLLLRARVPAGIVATLDHALMHGLFTQREWVQRRDSARLRLGKCRLPIATWGSLLGEGALGAFVRLERAEENALLRSAAVCARSSDGVVNMMDVEVTRGDAAVLRDLRMSIGAGEWVAVCGPSGAGKSTLLRLAAGLDSPSKGHIERTGSRITASTSLRDRLDGQVALLCQNPEHHFIASTVAEDVAWGLRRRGIEESEAASRTRSMTDALGIGHLLERPCYQLSFGEQRRVALAGLLVLEPKLLLLDEPTAGLDSVAAHELAKQVRDVVGRTGAACMWATHDLSSLPKEVERVVLLSEQRVVFDGPVAEGLSRPWLARAGLAVLEKEESPC